MVMELFPIYSLYSKCIELYYSGKYLDRIDGIWEQILELKHFSEKNQFNTDLELFKKNIQQRSDF